MPDHIDSVGLVVVVGQRDDAWPAPSRALEEVPELDPVAGRVVEGDGAVAAVVLDRALDLDVGRAQVPHRVLQALR